MFVAVGVDVDPGKLAAGDASVCELDGDATVMGVGGNVAMAFGVSGDIGTAGERARA